MRRFLLFLILLLLLDQLVARGLEVGFRRTFSGASGGLVNLALRQEPDVIVLGSSRAQHHFIPRIIERNSGMSAFNAGADGQGLYYSLCVLDLLLQETRPRIVLWNLDYKDLDPARRPEQLQRLGVLLPFYDRAEVIRDLWAMNGTAARVKVLSRTYRFNSLALSVFKNLFVAPGEPDGYIPMPRRAGGFRPIPFDHIDQEADPVAIALLESALRRCSRLGIRTILLNAPRHWADGPPVEFNERFGRQFAALASSIDGVEFWDLDEVHLPEFRDARWFADSGHLSHEGAERFTRIVADRLAFGRELHFADPAPPPSR